MDAFAQPLFYCWGSERSEESAGIGCCKNPADPSVVGKTAMIKQATFFLSF
jgi:hypothetical protein